MTHRLKIELQHSTQLKKLKKKKRKGIHSSALLKVQCFSSAVVTEKYSPVCTNLGIAWAVSSPSFLIAMYSSLVY